MRKPKILIDANPVVPYLALGKISGIGRTCMDLIAELGRQKEKLPFDIELYTQNLKGVTASALHSGFKTRHIYLRHKEPYTDWVRRLRLREAISRYDLQHITHNYENVDPSRCVVTIHDAMFFSYPEEALDSAKNRNVVPPFARKARHIITISENSKREIMEYMDVPEEKISVIPWGVDHQLYYPHKVNGNRWSGTSPYFAAVSCSGGRKNTISVLRAFEKFSRNNPTHHLVIVWANPTEEARRIAAMSGLKGRIHFTSHLPNEELADLYAGATATFFPSLYEGFGLPVLESMACGVPCVTARNSSLPEVGGDAAIYVEPLDVEAIAKEMEKFENGDYDMTALQEASLRQASRFRWDKCAAATIAVYKHCL